MIYVGLILFLLTNYVLSLKTRLRYYHRDRSEKKLLLIGIWAIYLLLALKGESVGIDIKVYSEQYYLQQATSWFDYSYHNFEPGYVFITKLFSKLHIPFQLFLMILYAVACHALYLFIKTYSKNVTFSLLVFVCYQSFVFYSSGLRQTLAISICLYAFMIFDSQKYSGLKRLLIAVLLVFLANLIHESALLFLLVLPLSKIKDVKWTVMLFLPLLIMIVFFKTAIFNALVLLVGTFRMETASELGSNFYLTICLAIFSCVALFQRPKASDKTTDEKAKRFSVVTANVLLFSVLLQVLFAETQLFRSVMYLVVFLIPGLTTSIKRFSRPLEIAATLVLGTLFIYIFINEALIPNSLEILPYVFFWQ